MPFDLALTNYNVKTARYNFARGADGDVAFDSTQAYPVMTSVICTRGRYWANRQFGSLLFTIENLTSRTPSQVEATIRDAVLPLQQLGLISKDPVVSAKRGPAFGQVAADLTWKTPGGLGGSKKVL